MNNNHKKAGYYVVFLLVSQGCLLFVVKSVRGFNLSLLRKKEKETTTTTKKKKKKTDRIRF